VDASRDLLYTKTILPIKRLQAFSQPIFATHVFCIARFAGKERIGRQDDLAWLPSLPDLNEEPQKTFKEKDLYENKR
jgi:hypothetical protein